MKQAAALVLLVTLLASCGPTVKVTTSRRVVTEPMAECRATDGPRPLSIDTSCSEGTPRCYKIRALPPGLQSVADEFGVSTAADLADPAGELLVYTSMKSLDGGVAGRDASQNLWFAQRGAGGAIRFTQPLTSNMRIVHEGAPSMSPDGAWLYFAAKNRPDTLGDCDIYMARILRKGERISLDAPMLIPRINSPYFDSHPSISPDGTTLYFASDRPGGYGNTDLWTSTRDANGAWSEPANLGPVLNTSCNEMTPFICGDNTTLYFASDGHGSVGGLDIFLTERSSGGWSNPVNAGVPLNTTDDEFFPSTPPSARADSILLFASNRPGGAGGYDLYGISPNPQPPSLVTLRGTVRGARAQEAVPHARLFWKDKGSGAVVATVETNQNGEYYVVLTKGRRYDVGAQAERYFYDTYEVDAPDTPGVREYSHDFLLAETLNLRINFPFNDAEHPLDSVLDENGEPTSSTWKDAIEYLALNLTSYRDRIARITLAGHTDSVGTREYNRLLSQKRAEFVRSILQTVHGISPDIISIMARGEDELLSRRPGESDEVFNTRCRRVELTKVARKDGERR
ncbi:MAG: PD40 domain-containing protein [Ignavibacteria bacterium]|nr:PD40 domain-containing protein [Ignavibacteria bacterium]